MDAPRKHKEGEIRPPFLRGSGVGVFFFGGMLEYWQRKTALWRAARLVLDCYAYIASFFLAPLDAGNYGAVFVLHLHYLSKVRSAIFGGAFHRALGGDGVFTAIAGVAPNFTDICCHNISPFLFFNHATRLIWILSILFLVYCLFDQVLYVV